MGTTWHVSYSARGGVGEAQMQKGIESVLEQVNDSMSTYRPDSEITAVNNAPPGVWMPISRPFAEVLKVAVDVGERSGAAYDVTVAPLVELWGFGASSQGLNLRSSVPGAAEIAQALENVGLHQMEIDWDNQQVRKLRPLTIDFSSVAKGYAVDLVANYLLGEQIEDFLVEVGGEMRLAGLSPRGGPWRIAVEQPESEQRTIGRALQLSDCAVATSGDYRNFIEIEGERYSHTIDPRTGYPVDHTLVSVTVIGDTAAQADAWATALSVLGDDAMAVAREHALAVYLIYRTEQGLVERHSEQFAPFLEGE